MDGNTAFILLELIGIIFLFAAIFAIRAIVKDQPEKAAAPLVRDDAARNVKS